MAGDEVIRSRSNPLLVRLRALRRRASSDAELCLLEGRRLVEAALAAGVALVEVAAAPSFLEEHPALARTLEERGVGLRRVRADLLAQLSELENSPGILALGRRPRFDSERAFESPALLLAALGVQDPGNLGALVRTAEAAGASGVLLSEGCADPYSWKALRGSMGAALRLPLLRRATPGELLAELRRRDVRIVAADAKGEARYEQIDYRGATAFVVGGEGGGLPAAVRESADSVVAIPMRVPVESLNVAVAAGILLFEAARQRRG